MQVHLLSNLSLTELAQKVIETDKRQAAKRTSQIREEIETSLRQFREKLEDVENVVAVYTNEEEIIAAALDVIVSILQAIEDIVDYYWANKGKS